MEELGVGADELEEFSLRGASVLVLTYSADSYEIRMEPFRDEMVTDTHPRSDWLVVQLSGEYVVIGWVPHGCGQNRPTPRMDG